VRTLLFVSVLALTWSCMAGCGYHSINRESSARFGDGKTVSIPIFANKTYKPNLEIALVNDLIDEFSRRRGLRVVDSEASDYTLSGEVLTYYKLPISYTAYDIVKEYKATMTVTAALRRNSTKQVAWKGELSWSQDFPASSDIAIQQNSEDAAILEISRRLAQQLFLKISSDF